MSTARTAHGCLVEDYPQEFAQICRYYIAQMEQLKRVSHVKAHPPSIQLNIDVAESLINMVES